MLTKIPKQRCGTHNCPDCNKLTKCDLENGKSVCWCFTKPIKDNKVGHSEGQQCLCRTCLDELKNLK